MIVHDLTIDASAEVLDELFAFSYREHFKMSAIELENEPWEALYQARLIWSLEAERAKLENIRQQRN